MNTHTLKIKTGIIFSYVFCCTFLLACQNETKSLSDIHSKQKNQHTHSAINDPHQSEPTTQETDELSQKRMPKAIEDAQTTFTFSTIEYQDKLSTIQVFYHRRTKQVGARSMELFLEYPPHLQMSQYLPLKSIEQSNKELIIQSKEPGVSRILIYGINMNELDSGPLFQVTFNTNDSISGMLHVREKFPLFAPALANEGVVFPKAYPLNGQ